MDLSDGKLGMRASQESSCNMPPHSKLVKKVMIL